MSNTANIIPGRNSDGDGYLSATYITAPSGDQAWNAPASGCLMCKLGTDASKYRGVEVQLITNAADNATITGIELGLVNRYTGKNGNSDISQYTPLYTTVTATAGSLAVSSSLITDLGLTGSWLYCDTISAGATAGFVASRLDAESGLATFIYSPADNTRASFVLPYTTDAAAVYVYGGGGLSSSKILVALFRPYGGSAQ